MSDGLPSNRKLLSLLLDYGLILSIIFHTDQSAMSNTPFKIPSSASFRQQPESATKIIFRSSSDSDVYPMYLRLLGSVSGTPTFEDVNFSSTPGLESQSSNSFESLDLAVMSDPPAGTVTALSEGVSATGDITTQANPSDGDTLTIWLGSHTTVYRFKTTLAAAYDVQIGSSAADTTSNLKAAINADGTPGTEYYAGTLANTVVEATQDSTTVLIITDRIPCRRQLTWALTESSTNFLKRPPYGGVDGDTLMIFTASSYTISNPLSFSAEDTLTATLPALTQGQSGSIYVGGGQCAFRLYSDQALTIQFYTSTDNLNWHADTQFGAISLSGWEQGTFDFPCEYIKMEIASNVNTTGTVFDARVIYP